MSAVRKVVIGNATLYRGECTQVLRDLPGELAAVITDPPYSSGGMVRGDRMQSTAAKYVHDGTPQDAAHNVEFSGDNRDARSWAFWVSMWLAMLQPKVRAGGYVMVFTDWRQLPALTDALQAGGFVWRGLVPWDKTESSRAPHKGYFRHQCEYVVWGSNGPLPIATHGGPWPGLIRERVNPREKHHMTGKPISLMEELVRVVPPGGVIVDPFMGSGSTGVAAARHGYPFVGMELTDHYFDIACRRIAQAQAQRPLLPPPVLPAPLAQQELTG